jgi:hypothetical protein
MKREDALNAFVIDDSPNGEVLINATAFACDYCAYEDLDAFLIGLCYFAADFYGIADFEMRDFAFEVFAFDGV